MPLSEGDVDIILKEIKGNELSISLIKGAKAGYLEGQSKLGRKLGVAFDWSRVPEDAWEDLRERQISLSRSTLRDIAEGEAESGRLDLRRSLLEGVKKGEAMPQMLERVGKLFKEAKTWKADRIARTEPAVSFNNGRIRASKEAGVKYARVSLGSNPCDWCIGESQRLGVAPISEIQAFFDEHHPYVDCTFVPVIKPEEISPPSSEEVAPKVKIKPKRKRARRAKLTRMTDANIKKFLKDKFISEGNITKELMLKIMREKEFEFLRRDEFFAKLKGIRCMSHERFTKNPNSLGFYQPREKIIYIRPEISESDFRFYRTLEHELMHHLNWTWKGLKRFGAAETELADCFIDAKRKLLERLKTMRAQKRSVPSGLISRLTEYETAPYAGLGKEYMDKLHEMNFDFLKIGISRGYGFFDLGEFIATSAELYSRNPRQMELHMPKAYKIFKKIFG